MSARQDEIRLNRHTYRWGKLNKKGAGVALIMVSFIVFGAISVVTDFGWVIYVRFYFNLLPFEESKSASVAMIDESTDSLVVRPISKRYQLKMMDFIVSVTKGDEIVVLEGKHGEMPLMNRTVPRYSMGWVNPTSIKLFGTEYDVWYLEMWVREEALYLNIRYREVDYVTEKLFLVAAPNLAHVDPELAKKAYALLLDIWSKS
jgi:hypothetical protein